MQHYHLHFTSGCGIIIVSRGERNKPLLGLSPSEVKLGTPHKKHERTSRKPLDKPHTMWYNKNVNEGLHPIRTRQTPTAERKTDRQRVEGFSKKFFKNFEKSIDKAC